MRSYGTVEGAEFIEEAQFRMAVLRALRRIDWTVSMVVELCVESIIACTGDSNPV